MNNQRIASLFFEMANMYEYLGIRWKPRAFRKAGQAIGALRKDIIDIYRKEGIKGLKKIPGVGEGIAKKIVQFLETGRIKEYEMLKKRMPMKSDEILTVYGIGPQKVKRLVRELGIRTIKDLEKAAKAGKIRLLAGFGAKSEEEILEGIRVAKTAGERYNLNNILPLARKLLARIKNVKDTQRASLAGSIRRNEPTVKDIDVLASSKNPTAVLEAFATASDVKKVLAKGSTKCSVRLKNNIQADLRVVDDKIFGAALQYFTGSKGHNIRIRQIAIRKGYKLSEYGLFDRKTGKFVAGKTEKSIYDKLGLPYLPPSKRK